MRRSHARRCRRSWPRSSAQWQAAGYTGEGATVAIVDSGFGGYEASLGQGLPAKVTKRSFNSDGTLTGSVHGTACAEIVHALAPDADCTSSRSRVRRPMARLSTIWRRRA